MKQNGEAKKFLCRYPVHRVKGQLGDERQGWEVATPKKDCLMSMAATFGKWKIVTLYVPFNNELDLLVLFCKMKNGSGPVNGLVRRRLKFFYWYQLNISY